MSALLPELRRTVRSLLQQPGFTGAAALTLALALGANIAIFRLVDSVLLTPPPFRDPGRIVVIWHRNPEVARTPWPPLPPALTPTRERGESDILSACPFPFLRRK